MRYLLSSVIIVLVLVSCASSGSSRKKGGGKSTFKTPSVYTNFDLSDDQIAKASELKYQVKAHCRGAKCMPQEAKLSFYIETGRNTVYLSNHDLSLNIDEKHYQWDGRFHWSDIRNSSPVMGNIISVPLKPDTLRKVANTKEVTGVLAGQSFEWSYDNRAPIRQMLAEMDSVAVKDD